MKEFPVIFALLVALSTVTAARQTNGIVATLPAGLSIVTGTTQKPTTLRYAKDEQTFDAQAREASVTTSSRGVAVTMTDGDFSWVQGKSVLVMSFATLELRFDSAGAWVFYKVDPKTVSTALP